MQPKHTCTRFLFDGCAGDGGESCNACHVIAERRTAAIIRAARARAITIEHAAIPARMLRLVAYALLAVSITGAALAAATGMDRAEHAELVERV